HDDIGANQGSPANFVDIMRQPFADLDLVSVVADPQGTNGQPLRVSWTVTNIGIASTSATSWTDRVSISSDPNGTGRRTLTTLERLGGLPVGGSYTQTLDVTLPNDAADTQYIFVEANNNGSVFEFVFTSNNLKRSAAVDVTFVPP